MTAAALDALAGEAERTEAGAPQGEGTGQAPQAPAEPALSNYQAIGTGLAMAREALCLALKVRSPQETLADERIAPVAQAWAKVCDERGIDLGAYMGGAVGVALAMSVPLAFAVYKGLSDELQARRAAPAAEAKAEAQGVAVDGQ